MHLNSLAVKHKLIGMPVAKLQAEVRRLQHDLQQQRQHRLELSEEILHEARSRLQTLQEYVGSRSLTFYVALAKLDLSMEAYWPGRIGRRKRSNQSFRITCGR